MKSNPEESINLNSEEKINDKLVDAELTSRLANVLIDAVLFYIAFAIIAAILSIIIKGFLFTMLLQIATIVGLYTFFEYNYNQTPGKMLTKTKVVTTTGGKPETNQIIIRSLCRFIPFEFISFFLGDKKGWHDTFSNTRVVKV